MTLINEMNNLNTLFSSLEQLNIFDEKFSENFQKTYDNFFAFDKKLVSEEPVKHEITDNDILSRDGRFCLDYNSAHFECYFRRGSAEKLICTFDGARTRNGKLRELMPFFPRWSWDPFIDGHFLCFEDPMYYRYKNLKIGWFYGNETEDYALYAAEIIKKLAGDLKIQNENIILYGSSAGGTAAIRTGSYINGSRVVAINPQLKISQYTWAKRFSEVTGIDPAGVDEFHRDDLPRLMAAPPQTV